MNPETYEAIARRFRVLGVPLRLQILHELAEGELTVSEIVDATGSTQPNVSKHLSTLLDNHLVTRTRQGNSAYYAIADEMTLDMCELVCDSIEKSLDDQRQAFAR